MNLLRPRLVYGALAIVCFGFVAFAALYFQGRLGLLPCPMCVVQRMAYMGIGLVALLSAMHDPACILGRRAYAAGAGLFAALGLGSASRHVYLLHNPGSIECGISPEEAFLNSLPLAKWWPSMFEANGDCAAVKWKLLGLSIPEWSAVWFVIMLAAAVLMFARAGRR